MNLKLIFLPLAVMLSVVISIWMVKPEWDTYKTNKAALGVANEEFKKVDSQVVALERALAQYKTQESDRTLIFNAIPYEVKKEDILEEVYEKIKESEVLMTSFMYSGSDAGQKNAACSTAASGAGKAPMINSIVNKAEAAEGTAAKAPAGKAPAAPVMPVCLSQEGISMDIIGPYPNVKKSLEGLSRMNRYTEINDLKLTRGTAEQEGKVTANLTLSFFHKGKNDAVQVGNALSTPAGIVLLQGKIENSVIEKYKTTVTEKVFNPMTVTGYGKDSLF